MKQLALSDDEGLLEVGEEHKLPPREAIDPNVLAALPEAIRKEVLFQSEGGHMRRSARGPKAIQGNGGGPGATASPGTTPKPREQRCKICREPGHNALTCPHRHPDAVYADTDEDEEEDPENYDECAICGEGGELVCCSVSKANGCGAAFHVACIHLTKEEMDDDDWQCYKCKGRAELETEYLALRARTARLQGQVDVCECATVRTLVAQLGEATQKLLGKQKAGGRGPPPVSPAAASPEVPNVPGPPSPERSPAAQDAAEKWGGDTEGYEGTAAGAPPKEKGKVISVVCNGTSALFTPSANFGKCIRVGCPAAVQLVSPTQFERLAGMQHADAWSASICRRKDDGTPGETLGAWLRQQGRGLAERFGVPYRQAAGKSAPPAPARARGGELPVITTHRGLRGRWGTPEEVVSLGGTLIYPSPDPADPLQCIRLGDGRVLSPAEFLAQVGYTSYGAWKKHIWVRNADGTPGEPLGEWLMGQPESITAQFVQESMLMKYKQALNPSKYGTPGTQPPPKRKAPEAPAAPAPQAKKAAVDKGLAKPKTGKGPAPPLLAKKKAAVNTGNLASVSTAKPTKQCSKCGRFDPGTKPTSRWRDGPQGKGTLCNKCGVEWENIFRGNI